jgi:hypothetical protein
MRLHEKPGYKRMAVVRAGVFRRDDVGTKCSRQNTPTSRSVVGSVVGHVHSAAIAEESPDVASKLAAVRALTAKYHDGEAALANRYQSGPGMVSSGAASRTERPQQWATTISVGRRWMT